MCAGQEAFEIFIVIEQAWKIIGPERRRSLLKSVLLPRAMISPRQTIDSSTIGAIQ